MRILRRASSLACSPSQKRKRGCLLYDGRLGFTMIEMVCVMLLLAVLAGAMALLLKETLEVERLQAEGFDKILQNKALADQFRADVAQAQDAPREWQQYKAGERTLILQMPKGHVVYLQDEGTLLRNAFQDGKSAARTLPIGACQVIEFDRDRQNRKVVRLLLQATRADSRLPGQTLTIAAALGGDWR
jgi:prepilin-type N-terminal cleavage/methylation domain-containing protein